MKLWTRMALLISVATSTSLTVAMAQEGKIGDLKIGGSACETSTGSKDLIRVEGSEFRYVIPTGIYLRKDAAKNLVRGACTFSLQVKANEGKKIIVANSEQLVSLRASPESTVRVDLELFKSGSVGEKQSKLVVAKDSVERSAEILRKLDLIAETECGGQILVRGNLTALLTGTGSARAYAKNLELDILEVPCE